MSSSNLSHEFRIHFNTRTLDLAKDGAQARRATYHHVDTHTSTPQRSKSIKGTGESSRTPISSNFNAQPEIQAVRVTNSSCNPTWQIPRPATGISETLHNPTTEKRCYNSANKCSNSIQIYRHRHQIALSRASFKNWQKNCK